MKVFSFLVVVPFVYLINITLAMRCYNCSLAEQHRCVNVKNLPRHKCPEPNVTLEEKKSLGFYPVCIKTTKPSKNNNTPPYTRRSCGFFDGHKDDCEELIEREFIETGANLSCYSCRKELCNLSNFLSHNYSIVLFSAIVAVMIVKTLTV